MCFCGGGWGILYARPAGWIQTADDVPPEEAERPEDDPRGSERSRNDARLDQELAQGDVEPLVRDSPLFESLSNKSSPIESIRWD